jgi:hypothetical protein
MTAVFVRTPEDVKKVVAAISEHCPTDFLVSEFDGYQLVVRGGRASSQWSDLEIAFAGV